MTAASSRVISIGECMVELARGSDGRFGLAFGGDTFNTAVYMARCGARVAYASQLGDDPYSDAIVALAKTEGVDADLLARVAGRMPGLYLIETASGGERTFHYWRERSPARELFEGAAAAKVIGALAEARLVYLSGITLSLYSEAGLERLAAGLAAARQAGARVAMDGNYRPRGWSGDAARAQRVMARFWRLTDIALPTFDDEAVLWGDISPDDTAARLADLGVGEAVIKLGPAGAVVARGTERSHVPIPRRVEAIDTTAAGDSFNAAYLTARLAGRDGQAAALAGHRLAGIVVQHRGAIAPHAATDGAVTRES